MNLVTSNLTNSLKTWTLLAALGGLLVAVGGLLGGQSGLVLALVFAVAMNAFVYWKSDSLALKANGARELGPDELPRLRAIVADLANRAGLPMPRLYLVDRPEPNAFATGRDPDHAAVAVTSGILDLMDERELRGVRPRAVPREEPRHPDRHDRRDGRRRDQLPRPDGAVPAVLRRWPR